MGAIEEMFSRGWYELIARDSVPWHVPLSIKGGWLGFVGLRGGGAFFRGESLQPFLQVGNYAAGAAAGDHGPSLSEDRLTPFAVGFSLPRAACAFPPSLPGT